MIWSILLALSAHATTPDLKVGAPATSVQGSFFAGNWDCGATTIDASGRRGRGHAACLRSYQVDAETGQTLMQFTVVVDSPRYQDLDERNLWLELERSDKTKRKLRFFGTANPTAQVTKRTAQRGEQRQVFDVVFSFDSFDLPSPIATAELRTVGEGSTTWGFTQGLAWPAAQEARTVGVTQNPKQVCQWDEVGPRDMQDVAAWLTGNRSSPDLHLDFDFALDDDDGEFIVELPRQGFEVILDADRLVVKGAENFSTRLSGLSMSKANPTPVAMDFDGDDLLVTVGNRAYGPFFVRRGASDGRPPEVVLSMEGDATLANLRGSMCTPVPDVEAPPPPPPPPAAPPEQSDDTRISRDDVDPIADLQRIQGSLGGITVNVQLGGLATSVDTSETMTTQQEQYLPPPPPPPPPLDYSSLEITGLSPVMKVTLDGRSVAWNNANGTFYAPQVRSGQRLRIVDAKVGTDWSADTRPTQLGTHEVCHFVSTPPDYAISCNVTGPVQGGSGSGVAFGGVVAEQGPQPMANGPFQDLLRRVDDVTFSSDQLDLIRQVARDHHFDCRQVTQLMEQLSMDSDKVKVGAALFPVTTDPENWYTVYDALTFSSSKDDLRKQTK